MASCIAIETGSLIFAILSLFTSCMGFLVCIALMVHMNILMAYLVNTHQRSVSDFSDLEIGLTNYGLYINIGLAVTLAFMVISLIFSIILLKGLLSRKKHLVKAYFYYGATANTISTVFAILTILLINVHLGLLNLFGCFLYSIILLMIKGTYDKLSKKDGQFSHKKLEAEKPTV